MTYTYNGIKNYALGDVVLSWDSNLKLQDVF